MKIMIRSIIAVLFFGLFTGCLTIEENYVFKKNGSGTMEYVVDLSEMGELLRSFDGLADGKEKKPKDEMEMVDMAEQAKALKAIPGIKKVKLDTKKEWVQRLKFSFSDLNALNAGLNVLMKDSTGTTTTFFKQEGNTLVRVNNAHAYELGAGLAGAANEDPSQQEDEALDMSSMLETMKYKYRFKFAREVGDLITAEGVIKERTSAKEFKIETNFSVIGSDRHALDLSIPMNK